MIHSERKREIKHENHGKPEKSAGKRLDQEGKRPDPLASQYITAPTFIFCHILHDN
jgi:hypothetical protein